MKDGYFKDIDNKLLYILDSKRNCIYCISKIIKNLSITTSFNTYGELSFDIDYDEKYKDIYNSFKRLRTHLRLEEYGEFIVDSVSEDNQGVYKTLTVGCKDEHYMFDKHNFSLVNTSTSYYSAPMAIFNEDGTISTSEENLTRRLFDKDYGGFPSWSTNKDLIDSEIDMTKKSFQGIKQIDLYKFIYENMEQAYDVIPFFDSLNRTISFKKTCNAIDDSGIIITFDTFIKALTKECTDDTFCTKMFTEGGNLTIRPVNPYGDNYVYDYSSIYDLCSSELKEHLQAFDTTWRQYSDAYKVAYAEWSDANTKLAEYQSQEDGLMPQYQEYAHELLIASQVYGDNSPEWKAVITRWNEWEANVGWDEIQTNLTKYENLVTTKKAPLDEINNKCKRDNFLTNDDYIELDQFDIEASYKQEAFSYIDGMTENEKSNISQMLKDYAEEEIKRYNSPRFNFTLSLSNFNNIFGCENFASQLNVGKYIRLMDKQGNIYKVIIVKIEYNQESPEELQITLSDKMSGHEYFPTLNEYLNKVIKQIEDLNETNQNVADLQDQLNKTNGNITSVKTSVDQLYTSLGDVSSKANNNPATNTTLGVVEIPSNSSISVVLEDKKDGSGNTTSKAGDIDIKVSDDFEKASDGTIGIKSGNVTRSAMESIEYYTDGFGYNKNYGFQWLSNGNILNCNTGKTITMTQYTDSVLKHFTVPTNESGD